MSGVEMGSEGQGEEIGGSYFVMKAIGVPNTSSTIRDACVKGLGRANRTEESIAAIMKYWLRLLETDETNPSGDAVRRQRSGRKQLSGQNYTEIGMDGHGEWKE
jgi:hypothetical protein